MPALHRYLGNPVLSFAGRLFFSSRIGDFHCGLRGVDRAAVLKLGLSAPGMEFASEMIVKATLAAGASRKSPPHCRQPVVRGRPIFGAGAMAGVTYASCS